MVDITSLLTEWETEIQQLEVILQQKKPRRQQQRLRLRLQAAYQSKQLLNGLGQQLFA